MRASRTISRRTVRIDRACSLFGIVRPTKIILIRSGNSLGDKGRLRAMSDTLCGNVITLPFKAVCAKDGSRVAENSLMTQLECRYYRRGHKKFTILIHCNLIVTRAISFCSGSVRHCNSGGTSPNHIKLLSDKARSLLVLSLS
jgi:hypothetical protein